MLCPTRKPQRNIEEGEMGFWRLLGNQSTVRIIGAFSHWTDYKYIKFYYFNKSIQYDKLTYNLI